MRRSKPPANCAAPNSIAFALPLAAGAAVDHRLHAGGAAVCRSGGRRAKNRRRSPSSMSAKPPAGRRKAPAAGPKMAALLAAAAEPVPDVPVVTLTSDGVILIYGRDEQAIEAANLLKDHLDVTVMITKPAALDAAPRQRIPGCEGDDPLGQGLSRRVRDRGRRFCRRGAVVARRVRFRAGPRRRGVALRHHSRYFRQRAAVPGATICATAICAPIRAIRPPCCARCSRRAIFVGSFDKPRYITFSDDALRAFALAHRRLPALSRSVSDRRDRAGRRSRRHRRQYLRRLRPVRRRMSDRRGRLCAAAGRCADAQAAHAAYSVSRSRRRAPDRVVSR